MYLGRVVGTCVASQKVAGMAGVKLLVVQLVTPGGVSTGRLQVACEVVHAGPGDHVALVGAREASHALAESFVPVDAAIIGIVDDVQHPSTERTS